MRTIPRNAGVMGLFQQPVERKNMFKKILVANRGEIALRIIRACRELGIACVAVYSEADTRSLHLQLADEQVLIGPPQSAKSYLSIENILAAARETGADAVHPGYGYLAENQKFAQACQDQGLVFIGPTPENLRLAGDKIAGKEIIRQAGVPVIPGGEGLVQSLDEAKRISREMGYPVMIKAAGGGGGRGIRICARRRYPGRGVPGGQDGSGRRLWSRWAVP